MVAGLLYSRWVRAIVRRYIFELRRRYILNAIAKDGLACNGGGLVGAFVFARRLFLHHGDFMLCLTKLITDMLDGGGGGVAIAYGKAAAKRRDHSGEPTPTLEC